MYFNSKAAISIINTLIRDNIDLALKAFQLWKKTPWKDPCDCIQDIIEQSNSTCTGPHGSDSELNKQD